MRRSAFLVLTVLMGLPGLARAQSASPYTPWIGGVLVSCTSSAGDPVAFVPNTSLADVGLGFPAWPDVPAHVEYNPGLLARLSPVMRLFWFGHVCAHQKLAAGSSEEAADRWAIQWLKQRGLASRADILELQSHLLNGFGVPWGHRPEPSRVELLPGCYDRAASGLVGEGSPGVKRWRFCGYIPGVSAPTSSGHASKDACEKERTRLRGQNARYILSECVLTSSELCSARPR